ncbi:hypothetical protein FRC06_003814 [Ceratobasidium sp. 370]|nr:hypothetical protein FRC06_003814 [Ceratobasidium sp. 370]
MSWTSIETPHASITTSTGSLRRRGSHGRYLASFCRLNCGVKSRAQQQLVYIFSEHGSDSSPSPSPSPSPPPPASAQDAQAGAVPSRSFRSSSHSSRSGSEPPRASPGGLQTVDEREGVATSEDGERTYYLEVVQSPERTAEFGNAVLSRLPLAPPLVVQLIVRNRSGSVIPIHGELPFLVAHLALLSENGVQYVDVPPNDSPHPIPLSQRLLYGTLASSPHPLQNQQGQPGTYFIFPDVSVRNCGRYRLRISLLRISRPDSNLVMEEGAGVAIVSTKTRVFEVVPQAEYVAPATTSLTQCFHRQGARMYTPPSSTPSARR